MNGLNIPAPMRSAASVTGRPGLSIFDPVLIGIDEFGHPVYLPLIYRNILIGGEPGAGKSSLLHTVVGYAALCHDCDLVLIDGKLLELGLFRACGEFVGPDPDHAIYTLERLQYVLNNRLVYLLDTQSQKIEKGGPFRPILLAIDELAFFSATVGTETQQKYFAGLNRDIASRGRAVGIIDASATQRPSSDIIPTSLRCLFAWRWAGRCVDDSSSDVVLGHGWAGKGYSAANIPPVNRGQGLLIAEDGIPLRMKGSFMTTAEVVRVARYATALRSNPGFTLTTDVRAAA